MDDLVLVADSPLGLQNTFQKIQPVLEATGLKINTKKSITFQWLKDGKKKMIFDHRPFIRVRGQPLQALRITDQFKYLGIFFTPRGKTPAKTDLREKLMTLQGAPLKPQQKLFLLVHHLLPGFQHTLTFGKISCGFLKKLDIVIRSLVRNILKLPKDTPTAFFHASIKDGGLGVPSMRWNIPVLAHKRGNFNRMIYDGEVELRSTTQAATRWRRLLYNSCDGSGLREASAVPQCHRWLSDGTSLMSGRSFISAVQVRSNTLFSRARAARGRPEKQQAHQCSRGCPQPETLNHILQVCFATHKQRIKRHNNIVDYLHRGLLQRGFTVHTEPRFETPGILKPDLVVYSEEEVSVIDIQVVNDQYSLEVANKNKIQKYEEPLRPHLQGLRSKYSVIGLTINWRGILCRTSVEELLKRRMISKRDLKILKVKTLEGNARIHGCHQDMTSHVSGLKKGVG
ncbi:hypothetical protein JTE90_015730 [Oedothorax gibbosus]|uniref:Reverse transcriptase domain-containing protein n=1 Tax=Oedothorax gibbosus TaxID=931172 RepID=A0AAV6TZS3_9ARAC|nr:hypothetical protein JTE90_015730 [Oedothorax gibbosus]